MFENLNIIRININLINKKNLTKNKNRKKFFYKFTF